MIVIKGIGELGFVGCSLEGSKSIANDSTFRVSLAYLGSIRAFYILAPHGDLFLSSSLFYTDGWLYPDVRLVLVNHRVY